MTDKKGISLFEVLLVLAMFSLTVGIAVQAFVALNKDLNVVMSYLGSHLKGREIIDIMARDCRMSARVMDGYSGFTTTDDCLVLKVPSVDAGGDIIDVNNKFDYVVYRISGADLWKTVMPDAGSARPASDGIMKKNVNSMYLSTDGTPLSEVAYKSAIKEITLQVSLEDMVLEHTVSVSPRTTVKIMNYEWEYVR